MEAREYLKMLMNMCNEEEEKGCSGCPLRCHGCGVPKSDKEIELIIKAVEQYEKTRS